MATYIKSYRKSFFGAGAFIIAVLAFATAWQAPKVQSAGASQETRQELARHFRSYEEVQLDARTFAQQVRRSGRVEIQSATQTLSDDLHGLGRPDTESGQRAKDTIDQLATNLDTSLQKINEAVDNASGTAGAVTAASTIGTSLVAMADHVSTAFQQLQDIDAQGELKSAFESADSCAGLTTTS